MRKMSRVHKPHRWQWLWLIPAALLVWWPLWFLFMGALDYNTGKAVLKLLQDTCRDTGMTVVVITHNQAITAMADRIIRVKSGTIRSMEMNEHITPVEEIEW